MDGHLAASQILVTGAGGFIGGAIARSLASKAGFAVRGGTRDGRSLATGVAATKLDVRDARNLASALQGVDAVVHCAVGDRQTTVEGTARMVAAAREAGVRRFIHFSSIAVYGDREGTVDETASLVSAEGQGYAPWKVAAEAVCREAGGSGIEMVILRPAIVYGANSLQWIVKPAKRLNTGRWGALGEIGRGTCNAVHVDDVAAACLAAIGAPAHAAAGEAFNISGPETISWDGWYSRLADAIGCQELRPISPSRWRRRMIGSLPFKALGRVLPAAERLFEARILSAPSPSEMTLFGLAATYPIGKATAVLGWQPRIGLNEGLANAVAWLRSEGLAQ